MRLLTPPGVALAVAQRRLVPGYSLPALVDDGIDASNTLRARATATGGVANTKGAWTQIVAATVTDISLLHVGLTAATSANATNTSALLDIGIGGAGSEVVIVPNLAVGYFFQNAQVQPPSFTIPVRIPVGSRIAVRCQGAEASKSIAVQMMFGQLPNGRSAPVAILDMGTDTSTSKGAVIATPAAINTKSAWTQIIAATAQPLDALAIGVQGGADTTEQASTGLVDIGYGSAGNEVVLAPNLPILLHTNESIGWLCIPPPLIPCRLPANTRLAVRWQYSVAGSTIDAILYGVPA